jgi:hypothetical protein
LGRVGRSATGGDCIAFFHPIVVLVLAGLGLGCEVRSHGRCLAREGLPSGRVLVASGRNTLSNPLKTRVEFIRNGGRLVVPDGTGGGDGRGNRLGSGVFTVGC